MASKVKKPMKLFGSRSSGGNRSLADLNRRSGPDSDSDSDEPQEHDTGGEKSDILNQARQLGAIEGCPSDNLLPSPNSTSLAGTTRLLSGETLPATPQQPEPIIQEMVFWHNDFAKNNDPLSRKLEDPENASFLEEPERSTVAFQGVGRTLGGNTNPVSSEPRMAISPPPDGLVIDETKPTTSIQLRLADGTKMIAHFNYHHTIKDIRGFIDSSRPGGSKTYQLQTIGFPPKPLIDPNLTIEQAGLANSVVVQKL